VNTRFLPLGKRLYEGCVRAPYTPKLKSVKHEKWWMEKKRKNEHESQAKHWGSQNSQQIQTL
jgi:hypothetical protein